MPIIVDHDERRLQIAAVVKRMVAKSGLEAVTFRNVAREAGFSSTIVSHYFRDKRDLLSFTFHSVHTLAIERIEDAFKQHANLLDCFEEVLPIDTPKLVDWQAWFGFWGKATSDDALAAGRMAGTEGTHRLFKRILEHAQLEGELPEHLDLDFHATRLQMFINGLAAFVVIAPENWPPARQRAMLAVEIEVIRTYAAAPAEAEPPKRRRRAAAR